MAKQIDLLFAPVPAARSEALGWSWVEDNLS
jgi:hypothetical protein